MGADGIPDRHLVDGLRRGNSMALGRLYDRYAPLVFTLAYNSHPDAAEAITEEVFVELWQAGMLSTLRLPVLPALISLTVEQLAATGASSRRLPALAPFAHLAPPAFDILVLTLLGQLCLEEIAVALEMDGAAITQVLASGLADLRLPAPGWNEGLALNG